MGEVVISDAARAAAEWWGQYVSGAVGTRNVGLEGMGGALLYATPPPPPEGEDKAEEFVSMLAWRIQRLLDLTPEGQPAWAQLSTDYGPEGLLRDVIEETGLRGAWPLKTLMSISPEFVGVCAGYHARMKAVYGERECPDCKPYLRSEAAEDGYGFKHSKHVYGEATGKRLEWESNNERASGDDRYTQPLGKHTVTDDPCRTCGGAKVLRPREEAAVA